MNRERMETYYRVFNTGDLEALADFYAEDIVFEYRDVKIEGREALIKYFAALQQGFTETIHPKSILVDGDRIAVETEDAFTAKVDLPDFLGQSLKQGESVTARYGCFYDTRDDRIHHVRLYSYS